MKIKIAITAIILITAMVFALPAAAAPGKNALGMVLEVKGKVRLETSGQKPQNLAPMANLFAGDIVVCPKGGQVTFITFSDNVEHTLSGGSARITEKGVKKVSGSINSNAPKTGAVLPANSRIGSRKLLGESLRNRRDFVFISPADSGAIIDLPHTFRWHFSSPVKKAKFIIKDQKIWEESDITDFDKLEKAAAVTNQTVTGTSVKYPVPGQKPLMPGRSYLMYVIPIGNNQNPADVSAGAGDTPGSFRVLSKEEAELVKAGQKATDEAMAKDPKNPAPLMKMSRIYLEYGLFDEALETTRKLEELMPDNPNVYWTLASIYKQTGRAEEMSKAQRKAVDLEKKCR